MNTAVNNPKHAAGLKKAPLHHIPPSAMIQEGRVMALGAAKYGSYNWGEAGVVASVYYDAILRHLFAWWTGADTDPESKVSPLAHIRACCGLLIDCIDKGLLDDDRPIGKTADAEAAMKRIAALLADAEAAPSAESRFFKVGDRVQGRYSGQKGTVVAAGFLYSRPVIHIVWDNGERSDYVTERAFRPIREDDDEFDDFRPGGTD